MNNPTQGKINAQNAVNISMPFKKDNIKVSTSVKLFTYALLLLPILYQYKCIGSILSFGEIIIAIITVGILFKDRFKLNKIDGSLAIFYIVSIFTTLFCAFFSWFDVAAAGTVILRMVFYAIVINLARRYFDLRYGAKFYILLVELLSIYLIFQVFYFAITGGYLPIYLNYNWQFPPEARPNDLSIYYMWNFRASSLFLEPSYFALYSLPCVVIILFKRNKKINDIITLVITCIAILFSTASSGLVGLVITFAVYFFKRTDNAIKHGSLIKFIIVLTAIAVAFIFLFASENSEFILYRLSTGGSFNQRVTRGIIIYTKLPFINQLFGVGLNNVEAYMLKYNLSTPYDEGNLNYSCSLIQTLNYFGLIGLLILILFLLSLLKRIMLTVKKSNSASDFIDSGALYAIFILLCFIICYESILFTYRMAFLFSILYGLIKAYKNEC